MRSGACRALPARLLLFVVGLATVLLVPPAAASADSCANAVLRSGPSSRLPDCRAYEMVTPTYKEGFPVKVGGFGQHSSFAEDGSHVWGASVGVFAGSEVDSFFFGLDENGSLGEGGSYIFTRGESGWATTAISPPASQYPLSVPLDFNPDFSASLWVAVSNAQDAARRAAGTELALESLYVRKGNGPIVEVGPVMPPSVAPTEIKRGLTFSLRGASSDLSDVFFSLKEKHWPGDQTEPGGESEYEYVGTGSSAPLLVGVSGGPGSTSLVSRCGTRLGSAFYEKGLVGSLDGAVSSSGTVAFFTALACAGSPPVSEILARIDNDKPDAHTVAISEPSTEDCPACDTNAGALADATFVGASTDGSKVFFTTSQPLLGGDTSNNLYEYDFDAPRGPEHPSGRIVQVSGGDSTVPSPTAGVESVLSTGPDGSHVYFTASGVLTNAPNSLGQRAEAGHSNLYLYERDAQYPGGRTVFVLPFADLVKVSETEQPSVSRNGRFLAFSSSVDLTPDALSAMPQAYEYDSQTGGFVRVSIAQNGYNNDGNSGSARNAMVADDGAVFFETVNPLVPQAVNGAPNIYEYREGTVNLITDGMDTRTATFVGESVLDAISPSGRDVFFSTFDRLVPRDTDSQTDSYDARAGGGFSEPPPAPPCQADACQGPLSGAPVLLTPGSEFQAGGENVASAAAPTGPSTTVVKRKAKAKRKQAKGRRKRRARKTSHGSRGAGGIGGRR
jgi:hypothetical protein